MSDPFDMEWLLIDDRQTDAALKRSDPAYVAMLEAKIMELETTVKNLRGALERATWHAVMLSERGQVDAR